MNSLAYSIFINYSKNKLIHQSSLKPAKHISRPILPNQPFGKYSSSPESTNSISSLINIPEKYLKKPPSFYATSSTRLDQLFRYGTLEEQGYSWFTNTFCCISCRDMDS